MDITKETLDTALRSMRSEYSSFVVEMQEEYGLEIAENDADFTLQECGGDGTVIDENDLGSYEIRRINYARAIAKAIDEFKKLGV